MGSYRWPAGELVGFAQVPEVVESGYTALIRELPTGRALIMRFESEEHMRSARNVIGVIAKRLGMKVGTKQAAVVDGKPQLYIWRRDVEPRQDGGVMEQLRELMSEQDISD